MGASPDGKCVDRSFQTDARAEPARPDVGTASGASYGLVLLQELEDPLRGRTVVLELHRLAALGRVVQRLDGRVRARLACVLGRDAELGQRERLLWLLLGAHDPLQRRVARLVDGVRDGN